MRSTSRLRSRAGACRRGAARAGGATARPVRVSAIANASASVALVTTSPRSTPRCTMVCAICGRMPLMMQSAPISRAAATVLSRCCATSVSTVGTPVMSMMAIAGAGLDDPLQQALHHDLRALAVERADERQRQNALPQLHDRRGQLEHLLLLAHDDVFAALLIELRGEQAEPVEGQRGLPALPRRVLGPWSSNGGSNRTPAASGKRRTSPSRWARSRRARARSPTRSASRAAAPRRHLAQSHRTPGPP